MTTLGPFPGKTQPTPTPGLKNLHECRWEPTTRSRFPRIGPAESISGGSRPRRRRRRALLAKLCRVHRPRRPAADILFQCSDNTWQAYNRWPTITRSTLIPRETGPLGRRQFRSPLRPGVAVRWRGQRSADGGSGEFLPLEFPLAYWLEQHGYDVSYCSNSDMLSPERGLKCKAFISVGHDEYWDIRQYDSVKTMRDAGVNLLFLSGNTLCWVTPFRASSDGRPNRIIFRGDPMVATVPTPLLRGNMARSPNEAPTKGLVMGARNIDPVNGGGDWTVVEPDHWIFAGTGLKKGDRIRASRLGISRKSARPPRPGNRRRRHGLARGHPAAALDRDRLSRAQGKLRLQRLVDLLGARIVLAARPRPPLVPLVTAARPGQAPVQQMMHNLLHRVPCAGERRGGRINKVSGGSNFGQCAVVRLQPAPAAKGLNSCRKRRNRGHRRQAPWTTRTPWVAQIILALIFSVTSFFKLSYATPAQGQYLPTWVAARRPRPSVSSSCFALSCCSCHVPPRSRRYLPLSTSAARSSPI